MKQDSLERDRALMLGNGALVLLLGLLLGYLFAFSLIEKVSLWPFVDLDMRIPGDPARWRAAHTGNITNGLMIIAVALALPYLDLGRPARKFVAWGMVLTVWGNFAFYLCSALGASGRGLSMAPNRFGGGDLFSQFTFLVAYPGAIIAPAALAVLARAAFRRARSSKPTASQGG